MLFSFQILSFILATLLCFRHRRERSSFLHTTARRSFDPCAGRSCVWGMILNALPRGVGRFRMCSAALCTYSAERIFLFRVCRGLRAAPNAIFTGGVVEGNGSCRAGFLRKHPRGGRWPAPSPSAHYVRIHLSQRERQEHCWKPSDYS